ncbi:MAG: dCMP deaminase family protein, partial [Planctomycetes bacterium]|nr:dCMP deaminase family protein [Planctomycetota bacterium]
PPISWDEYFMSLAILVSLRSKDPSSKVGAVLVKDHKIIGTGYNGFPTGCDESRFPWERDIENEGWLNTKYPYVIHAEANALLNTVVSPKGAHLYVTLHPCNECAKLLIQGGIEKVTFLSDKYKGVDAFVAAQKLLSVTGIEARHLPAEELSLTTISQAFSELDQKKEES